jgi:hypothetical protein
MATADPSGTSKSGKRNWLKKPAWLVEGQEKTKQQEEEMFRRSGDCHADILAEQERRRKKREEKAERDQKAEVEKVEKQEAKRRRMMEEKKEEARRELEEERAKHDVLRDPNISSKRHDAPNVHSPPSPKPQPENKKTMVIEIADSEDDFSQPRRHRHSVSQNSDRQPSPSSNSGIGRASSESHNKRFSGEAVQDSVDGSFRDRVSNGDQYHEQNDIDADSPTIEAPSTTVDEGPNPPIFILIDPRIPGTKQLLVKRYYKDNLRVVRKTWCEKQGFTPEQTKSIILTWRGRRAYDVANCKSLGIELDEYGEPVIRAGQKGYDESGNKIVLEATTEELLEQDKNAAAEATRRKVEEDWEPPEQHETSLRVLLRAKGLRELKLRVISVFLSYPKRIFYCRKR